MDFFDIERLPRCYAPRITGDLVSEYFLCDLCVETLRPLRLKKAFVIRLLRFARNDNCLWKPKEIASSLRSSNNW
jgi:hypothetical protein